jgi:hypothetical protein
VIDERAWVVRRVSSTAAKLRAVLGALEAYNVTDAAMEQMDEEIRECEASIALLANVITYERCQRQARIEMNAAEAMRKRSA